MAHEDPGTRKFPFLSVICSQHANASEPQMPYGEKPTCTNPARLDQYFLQINPRLNPPKPFQAEDLRHASSRSGIYCLHTHLRRNPVSPNRSIHSTSASPHLGLSDATVLPCRTRVGVHGTRKTSAEIAYILGWRSENSSLDLLDWCFNSHAHALLLARIAR